MATKGKGSARGKGRSRVSVILGEFSHKGKKTKVVSQMMPTSISQLGYKEARPEELQGKRSIVKGSKGDDSMQVLFRDTKNKSGFTSYAIPIPSWLKVKDMLVIGKKNPKATAIVTPRGVRWGL